MPLYTKCPACRSEISFEPPANMASLPETYRHRIICPSCGVTIGVKLNTIARQPVQEVPLATKHVERVATSYEPAPTYNDSYNDDGEYYAEQAIESVPARKLENPKKKAGTGRNILMMIISLLFIAAGVLGYFVSAKKLNLPGGNTYGFEYLNGIGGWELLVKHFDSFKEMFQFDAVIGLMRILPMIIFTLSCITFVVAFISACGKKYGRAFNVIWAILILACGATLLFSPYIIEMRTTDGATLMSIGEYFKAVFVEEKWYLLIVPAALGLLQLLFSLIFIKSLKRKENK